MTKYLHKIFSDIENTPLGLGLWAMTFTSLIFTRLFLDLFIEGGFTLSFFQIFFQATHLFLFFLFSYLLLLPLVARSANTSLEKAARVLLFGFLVILLPPIIDRIIFGNSFYWSFYIFDELSQMPHRFFTFFGKNPHLGITYGVRTEVAFVLFGIFLYSYSATKKLFRSLSYTFFAYVLLFLLGTLPSWIAYIVLISHTPLFAITETQIAELFLSPQTILAQDISDLRSALGYKMNLFLFPASLFTLILLWIKAEKRSFLACFKNLRLPQIFYHGGLLLLGMLLAIIYGPTGITFDVFSLLALFTLLTAVTFAWSASVVCNDIFDTAIDKHTNNHRPLITHTVSLSWYKTYGILLLISSLLVAALVHFQAVLFLLGYQALAFLYSAPPLRLKRFVGVATLFASSASMTILFLGYTTLHPNHTLEGLPSLLVWYLFFVFTTLLPLKDFKDIAGDRADKVITLPVLIGERNAKTLMSILVFIAFGSSIFVFHTPELLLPALLFASLAFWIMQRAGTKKSIVTYPRLATVFMSLAFLYGVSLVIFLI